VAVIGIENGYPIGTDIEHVREFYDRGGRYMSVAHNGHNQLADSHTSEAALHLIAQHLLSLQHAPRRCADGIWPHTQRHGHSPCRVACMNA
jgi:hypothetical protein